MTGYGAVVCRFSSLSYVKSKRCFFSLGAVRVRFSFKFSWFQCGELSVCMHMFI